MSSSPPLRALWGAALCCALPLVARAAEGPCIEPWQSAPVLLAAAAQTAPATAPASPVHSLLGKGQGTFTGDISTSSDELSATADGLTRLSGHVDVHMGEREIQADQLTYDRNANTLSASGAVRYRDPIVLLQGDTGHYSDLGADFSHGQFELLKQSGHGSADEISMAPNKVITLRHVTYSSCPPPRSDWQIRARALTLDTNASRGVGHGTTVDFEGVPILYLPWISFPLSAARQSGVLFPNFGSSGLSGAFLGVPWYWNIAPNQDATFTPTIYSTRGVDLGAEYRLLTEETRGSVDANLMPYDRQTGGDRSFLRLTDRYQLDWNTRIDTNIENVSDDAYFEDFTQGTESTSTPFLPRSLAIGHRDDIWNLRAEMVGYQTLDYTLPVDERPYIQLPRLSAVGLWSPKAWPQLQTGFDTELVNFTRAGCNPCTASGDCTIPNPCNLGNTALDPMANVSGWRLDAMPRLGLDISGPGYFLRPDLAWELTQYELRDEAGADTSPERILPIVSVDSGLEFERLSGSGGTRSITLEPRAMYVYIPYRNQNQLPVFDSGIPDPNLIELFRPNRFVGIDRIGDENGLTLGLTSQTFDTASGTRYLSATIGQAIYFDPARVTLPGQALQSVGTSSLIAEVILSAYRNWNLQFDIASNPTVSAIEQDEVTLQYHASNQQVANISYRYRSGELAQIDSSVAWPIASHWDLYARAVYSLFDNPAATPAIHPEWIEDFAGFQYRGACWNIRAVWQRSVSTRTGAQSSGVSFQLELTGLSSVGSQVTSFLEQSIRGYSSSANRQPLF
ncbi:MAG TPA: LPS assembly protein LptD [Steroidobacteraceae bacterium]|nr:LPS assembly protein LptD [Steroidobacteraceae bacterium]